MRDGMDKKYKAVVFTSPMGSEKAGIRYAIKDMESGEIVDDAQGYGYKSAQKAYAGWAYKNRDKSRDDEKAKKEIIISKWMKENRTFIRLLDTLAFEIVKGSHAPEDKADVNFVRKLLEENGYVNTHVFLRRIPYCFGNDMHIGVDSLVSRQKENYTY